MSDKKVFIGTNWKMTKTLAEGREYVKQLSEVKQKLSLKIELFIIPSFPHLLPLKEEIQGTGIKLGAQNMHWEDRGAYTGEVSPLMLREIGLDLIELGHSERRQYYNENDIELNKKVKAALKSNLTPLLCIGENSKEKESDSGSKRLREQLEIALEGMSKEESRKVWIAYEPVWAIGENGIPATVDYVRKQHDSIRSLLIDMFGEVAYEVPILYGGSVNTENFEDYLSCENVSGLFIGRAAWDMNSFTKILSTINEKFNYDGEE